MNSVSNIRNRSVNYLKQKPISHRCSSDNPLIDVGADGYVLIKNSCTKWNALLIFKALSYSGSKNTNGYLQN